MLKSAEYFIIGLTVSGRKNDGFTVPLFLNGFPNFFTK